MEILTQSASYPWDCAQQQKSLPKQQVYMGLCNSGHLCAISELLWDCAKQRENENEHARRKISSERKLEHTGMDKW